MPSYFTASALVIQAFVWPFAYIFLKRNRSLEIRGLEHIINAENERDVRRAAGRLNESGVLFVSNHVSEIDYAAIIAGIRPYSKLFPLYFVGDSSKQYDNAKFGWRRYIYRSGIILKLCGVFPAIRGTGDYETALATHISILKSGKSLCIFPQGGYRNASEVHGGAGYLAEVTQAIIIPVHIVKTSASKFSVSFAKQFIIDDSSSEKFAGNERYKHIATEILNSAPQNE